MSSLSGSALLQTLRRMSHNLSMQQIRPSLEKRSNFYNETSSGYVRTGSLFRHRRRLRPLFIALVGALAVASILAVSPRVQEPTAADKPKLFKPARYEVVPGFFQSVNSTDDTTFDYV